MIDDSAAATTGMFPRVFRNPVPSASGRWIEVAPFVDRDDGLGPRLLPRLDECPTLPDDQIFWSIHVRPEDGLALCVGNYHSQDAALEVLHLLVGSLEQITDPLGRFH